jgi:hypothetical protein
MALYFALVLEGYFPQMYNQIKWHWHFIMREPASTLGIAFKVGAYYLFLSLSSGVQGVGVGQGALRLSRPDQIQEQETPSDQALSF